MTTTLPLLELTLNADADETHFAGVLQPHSRQTKTDTAGCRCDRWGHPCPNCVRTVATPKRVEQRPQKATTKGKQ